ncbi:MAG: hypothetical protein U0T75_07530 [Chitinophagales bacterium]
MDLLIALLSFFSIGYSTSGTTATIKWTNGDVATQVKSSDQYRTYLSNGGVSLFDRDGMPAVWVTVIKKD